MNGCFCHYQIAARILEDQAQLVAQRRAVLRQMQMTFDSDQLWALGEIRRALDDALREPFPTDHWWYWKQEQARHAAA
jgi:hypothetical protein